MGRDDGAGSPRSSLEAMMQRVKKQMLWNGGRECEWGRAI